MLLRARLTSWTVNGKAISSGLGGPAMTKNEIKTTVTQSDVITFIEAVADERQRTDASKILEMMSLLSGQPPKMWGPSIIGFGEHQYKYDSGHEGDSFRIGFSPRKGNTVFYIANGFTAHADLIAKLGKHKAGKSCFYITSLSDIDEDILAQLYSESLNYMQETCAAIARS